MNKSKFFKKIIVTGLALTLVLGSASAAFANKKHDDDDDDYKEKGREERHVKEMSQQSHINTKGNVQIGNGNTQFNIYFNDVKGTDVEWAIRNIASLASKRILEGYEDGDFRPRQTINQIEAIVTAVRLMGLRDKAESAAAKATILNFKDANKVPDWAVGYVAVAVENDLFLESDNKVQPEKAATRLWATTLLVKALKLDAEARASMNTVLTFKDENEIPAGSVGYVAVAVKRGLITGFENNTFRPNAPVTRAQMAALLDRTGSQMNDKDAIHGTVTTAVYNNTLSIIKGGVTQQVVIDANAFIYRNGVKITAAGLISGDEVRIGLYNSIVIFIDVTKTATVVPVVPVLPQAFEVNGLHKSLNYNTTLTQLLSITLIQADGSEVTYPVAAGVTYIGDQSQLLLNHAIKLKGTGTIVNSIEII